MSEGKRALKDLKGPTDFQEPRDPLDLLVRMGYLDIQGREESRDFKAKQGCLDPQELLDLRVSPVRLDLWVREDTPARQALQESRACLVLLAGKVPRVILEQLELRAIVDLLGCEASQVREASPENQDHQD